MEEQELQKAWRTFDIVEQHYQQLEKHRSSMLRGESCDLDDADCAAGQPTVTTSIPDLSPHTRTFSPTSPCFELSTPRGPQRQSPDEVEETHSGSAQSLHQVVLSARQLYGDGGSTN
mmetsp:Transcript_92973/g.240194  ORF Transcript_92973/g.240194 Transcript_92973/m.240194 type:complete len:117 (-) Transcript_92973:212-562(-)